MSLKMIEGLCRDYKGIKLVPLVEVKKQYLKLCDKYNWTPSNEGLVEFDTLVHNTINWKRGARVCTF